METGFPGVLVIWCLAVSSRGPAPFVSSQAAAGGSRLAAFGVSFGNAPGAILELGTEVG